MRTLVTPPDARTGGVELVGEQFGPGITVDGARRLGWEVVLSPGWVAPGQVILDAAHALLAVHSAEDLAWLGWLVGRTRIAPDPDRPRDREMVAALRYEYELARLRADATRIYLAPLARLAARLGLAEDAHRVSWTVETAAYRYTGSWRT